ncbi:PAS domain-containing protein [Pseudanabaena mucicola]|uniref:histidine kinase n=1 Tax=Pseudanabaena mucicola FACHB-723 TaxID=2692860 RepID=A0ABR7ZWY4_9CYAN|nr:PAS domain-containing protein [Pseudanabaena mucicola]MBD2188463.1 PAS domain-containing protein [Pseudanabaena mucicola FACHB-723]
MFDQSLSNLTCGECVLQKIAIAVPACLHSLCQRTDGSLSFTYISPYIQELQEVTVEEAMADASLLLNQIHPDDVDTYLAAVENSKHTLQPFHSEFRIITPSGRLKWIQVSTRPEKLPNQDVIWHGIALDVTEQKQTQLKIQQLNENLNEQAAQLQIAQQEAQQAKDELQKLGETALQLTENIPVGTYVAKLSDDGVFKFIFVSNRFLTMVNLQKQEVLADPNVVFQQIHPDDYQEFMRLNSQAMRERSHFYWEGKLSVNDQIRWYSVESIPRNLPNGSKVWEGVVIDITDRIETQQRIVQINNELEERVNQRTAELQASENLCRRYFDQDMIGMAMTSPSKGWLNANHRLCEILGYSFAELQELTWDQITYADDLDMNLEYFNRIISGETEGYEFDKRFIHKSGKIIYTRLSVQAHRQPDGNIDFLVVLIQDISDRKKVEIDLQESQEFLQKIADASPNIIFIYDIQEQRNIYVNREIGSILGYSPAEIQAMGTNFFPMLIHPEDLPTIASENEQLKEAVEGKIYECEYRMRNISGEWRWLYSRYSVFSRDAMGKVKFMIGSAQDVTARKLAEISLQQTYEELLQATRLKDEFLATMSHELRTPLNAILGMTESLQEEVYGEMNDRQIRALELIDQSGLHLLSLINDVLDIAKIESGQMQLQLTATSIISLCESSLKFIQPQALKKQIQVQINLPDIIPDIYLDERRIRQSLINLLNNAVKFTPDGGQITLEAIYPLSTQSSASASDLQYIRLLVKDSGIGIAPKAIGKLFQPFIQVDSALNRKYEGTGLGLAIVKRIIELHGGEVGVTSEVGVGSCFFIDLPCRNH